VDPILDSLTSAQREAVTHVDGPLLILAGPGSGKTRVVTHRIAYLLRQGIASSQILALTFTNKAADEVRERVSRMAPQTRVWMSTFHRFCARLLREHARLVGLEPNFVIYDTADSLRVLRRALGEVHRDLTRFTPDRIAAAISTAKNSLITHDRYQPKSGNPLGAIVADVYPLYQSRLLTSGAVDFDDLLLHVVTMLRESDELRAELDERYRYILVDEYQDTNLAQYTLVRSLSIDHPNLAVTGDPDQSIYGWRGANLRNILDFEVDYPQVRVVRLEQNYRSTQRILRVADSLIAHNRLRKAKRLYTDNDEGRAVRVVQYRDEADEAADIAGQIAAAIRGGRRPRDFAIFYRVNALSRALEAALHGRGIPFQIVNGVEFYQRKEVKDILAYLALVNNPRDDVAFLRVVNEPTRGIGATTLERLQEHAGQRGLTLLAAARAAKQVETLGAAPARKLLGFVELIDHLSELAHRPVEEILGHALSETAYDEQFRDSEAEEDQQRYANIQELLSAARQFDERWQEARGQEAGGRGQGAEGSDDAGVSLLTTHHSPFTTYPLEAFLEESSLVGDTDAWQSETDRVTLMTVHAAKGLEFPAIFIVALEQGLMPHERSREHPEQEEEERRLLFVGITRAREELQLSLARRRMFRGQIKITVPSMFLDELPRGELDWQERFAESPPADVASRLRAGPNPRRGEPASTDAKLMTGAQLEQITSTEAAAGPLAACGLAEAPTPVDMPRSSADRASPELFAQGMVVTHPEYGLGKIVALSGEADKRVATVNFATGAGQKTFVLAHSPLRPARPS
jgi:DNA helicase-2/ATP-dependent DNA helicase PcrA